MTDITKYRNVSLTHDVYANLIKISKTLTRVPGVKVSISKTVETLAEQEVQLLNGKGKKEKDKK